MTTNLGKFVLVFEENGQFQWFCEDLDNKKFRSLLYRERRDNTSKIRVSEQNIHEKNVCVFEWFNEKEWTTYHKSERDIKFIIKRYMSLEEIGQDYPELAEQIFLLLM